MAYHIDILHKSLKKAQIIVKCLKKAISHQAYFQSPLKYVIIFWLTDIYIKYVVLKKP